MFLEIHLAVILQTLDDSILECIRCFDKIKINNGRQGRTRMAFGFARKLGVGTIVS